MPARARLALMTAVLLWAVSFVATKVALEVAPPLVVVTLRLLISALCFLPFVAFTGGLKGLGGFRGLGWLLVLSLFGTSLHYATQTVGLQFTTASNGSVYTTTGPVTILLLSALILGEKITRRKALGVAIALAGVLVVMGWDTLRSFELGNVKGDLLVLSSIVLWGMFTVFGKEVTDRLGALRVTLWVTFLGAASMVPVGWLEARTAGFNLSDVTVDAWVAIVFLGVGCSFLATLLYFVALGLSESQKVGVYLYTIPPLTAVVAALYLGERITPNLVVGAALVVAGVALTERG
ncbi:MAG: DMT family transporter [Holophagae bacterium]